jgi:hypothetical protein
MNDQWEPFLEDVRKGDEAALMALADRLSEAGATAIADVLRRLVPVFLRTMPAAQITVLEFKKSFAYERQPVGADQCMCTRVRKFLVMFARDQAQRTSRPEAAITLLDLVSCPRDDLPERNFGEKARAFLNQHLSRLGLSALQEY